MDENRPLVSVCIPVYNRVNLIQETVMSVINQDYPNIEVIVQDNASTDGTWEWLQSMAEKYPQLSIEQNTDNYGTFYNWNWAMRRSRGDYRMWLSSDDLLEPGFISECVDAFKNKTDAVTTNYNYLEGSMRRVRQKTLVEGFYKGGLPWLIRRPNMFNINFTLFSRETVDKLSSKGYLMKKKLMAGDYDFWFRFLLSGRNVYYLNKPLGSYRVHGDNDSKNKERLRKHTVLVLLSHRRVLKKKYGFAYRLTMIHYLIRFSHPRNYNRRLCCVLFREALGR